MCGQLCRHASLDNILADSNNPPPGKATCLGSVCISSIIDTVIGKKKEKKEMAEHGSHCISRS